MQETISVGLSQTYVAEVVSSVVKQDILLSMIYSYLHLMAGKRKNKKSKEELNTENELLKLQMMAQFGGNFESSDEIPAEVENVFLKQIISFHKRHDKSPTITVYSLLGEPDYDHVNDLNDSELTAALARLRKLMMRKKIALIALPETPEREIYRFITEELFKHEIKDMKAKGWVNQFIYEDFHPKPDYEVRNLISYIMHWMFSNDEIFISEYFSDEYKNSLGLSEDPEESNSRVESFKSKFHNIRLERYTLPLVDVNWEAGTAHAVCNVTYGIQTEKGKRYQQRAASVEVYLERDATENAWWLISRIATDLF